MSEGLPDGVPVGAVAEHLGISRRRVQQHVRAGVLPGPVARGQYDLSACTLAFIEHLRARAGRGGETSGYFVSRALSEAAKARLLTLEADEKEGELVLLAEVKTEAFARARAARDALDAMRSRLAPLLAGESDPLRCDQLLAAEIRRVCEELSGGRFGVN